MSSTNRLELPVNGTRCQWLGLVLTGALLITATAPNCHAQSWNEIFQQSKTQKKYLLQQIAALQLYTGYARKGYQVVGSGLGVIKDITGGEFSMHQAFFSSLKKVSPAISNDLRIPEIIAMQVGILKSFATLRRSDFLSQDNLAYVGMVADGVIGECLNDLEELLGVIVSGKLVMNDQERLERLARIYGSMQDKYSFTQDFLGNTSLLIRQKQSELNGIDYLGRYYEKQ